MWVSSDQGSQHATVSVQTNIMQLKRAPGFTQQASPLKQAHSALLSPFFAIALVKSLGSGMKLRLLPQVSRILLTMYMCGLVYVNVNTHFKELFLSHFPSRVLVFRITDSLSWYTDSCAESLSGKTLDIVSCWFSVFVSHSLSRFFLLSCIAWLIKQIELVQSLQKQMDWRPATVWHELKHGSLFLADPTEEINTVLSINFATIRERKTRLI